MNGRVQQDIIIIIGGANARFIVYTPQICLILGGQVKLEYH